MLFWAFMVVVISKSCARGAEIKLAWNANPADQKIVRYDLKAWQVFGTQEIVVPTTATTVAVPGLQAGSAYFFAVRAVNAQGSTSAYSPAIMATPAATVRLTVQRSADMATWADMPEVPPVTIPTNEREFFRIKIESNP